MTMHPRLYPTGISVEYQSVSCMTLGCADEPTTRGIAVVLLPFVGIIGTSTVTHGIQDSRANDRRCLAIQGDMLAAQPRRADGRDLFQALGCRPKGEGSVYAVPVPITASKQS